jgi:uncharacterized protein YbcV (DUF1398 family)
MISIDSVMFTIEQINDLDTRLGRARRFREYVRALKALSVERYDSYLADGHSEHFGQGGHTVVSPPVHEVFPVAETGQRETFLQHLQRHERRETTFLEMSRGLSKSSLWEQDWINLPGAIWCYSAFMPVGSLSIYRASER